MSNLWRDATGDAGGRTRERVPGCGRGTGEEENVVGEKKGESFDEKKDEE